MDAHAQGGEDERNELDDSDHRRHPVLTGRF
jgi:hypothetical protein